MYIGVFNKNNTYQKIKKTKYLVDINKGYIFAKEYKQINTNIMSKNKNLHSAKKEKNDEFYTLYDDIKKEVEEYKVQLKDKIIYCNCDVPESSSFWKYLSDNFTYYNLKKLISSHYNPNGNSYKLEISSDINNKIITTKTQLIENGDFRTDECVEILKQADIVITNPPFSLFREYIAQLMEYDKKFLILGNNNAITYKDIFTYIKANRMWLGYTSNKTMFFQLSDDYEKWNYIKDDKKYGNVPAISWFTNLDNKKRHIDLIRNVLYKKYNEVDYPKYDNYDAINIDKVANIPVDYFGCMGVPITYLSKHNPEQFEIFGQGQGNLYRELIDKGLSKEFVDNYYKNGGKGSIKENHPVLGYYDKDGKAVIPYMRIIIKRK
jgi:hypothetical protein